MRSRRSGARSTQTSCKDHFVTPRHVYICMEIVTGGEIYNQLEQKGEFPEEQARKYFSTWSRRWSTATRPGSATEI